MDLSSFNCPKCDFVDSNLDSLRIHCQKKHKIDSNSLYKFLFLNGSAPTCACGCGSTPKFWSLQRGYAQFVRGHSMRVTNNWGHNAAAKEKSLKKRRDEGLWSRNPWNKGLSKENDERLQKLSETMKSQHGDRYSDLMRENRLSGAIPTLKGSNHPGWRGGTSELGAMCRSRLYREWSFPKMSAAGFKCTDCGSDRNLEVHHDVERFASILHKGIETLGEPGDDWDRKTCFVDWVLWYHKTHDVSGDVLCESCHSGLHSSQTVA